MAVSTSRGPQNKAKRTMILIGEYQHVGREAVKLAAHNILPPALTCSDINVSLNLYVNIST